MSLVSERGGKYGECESGGAVAHWLVLRAGDLSGTIAQVLLAAAAGRASVSGRRDG